MTARYHGLQGSVLVLKKSLVIACCAFSLAASAQSTAPAKVVVYKWSQGGVVHYSTQPPRGKGHVVKLDERGLPIRDDDDILASANALRPMRPGQSQDAPKVAVNEKPQSERTGNGDEAALPEGAISKTERCANAQEEIRTIESADPNQPINVEDSEGNLIPMTDEQKKARLDNAKALVERLCAE